MTGRSFFPRIAAAPVLLATSALVLSLAGCGEGSGRVEVTGSVTLDGQPLDSGLINFRPAEGHSAASSGGGIVDGGFELPGEKGLQPGKYRVTIQAFRKTGRMFPQVDPGGPQMPEQVPIEFNEADQLEATVVAGGENHFEFQLTTAQ